MSEHADRPNISGDLIWEIVRNQNAYLVKRNSGGGVQFSRDPLNLTNKHSRKHAGFVNEKAVGVQPTADGGVTIVTKKKMRAYKPGQHHNHTAWGKGTSNQKVFKGVANFTGKNSYRSDLNQAAVSRASAIKLSQKEKADAPAKKPRGVKAKKEAEKE